MKPNAVWLPEATASRASSVGLRPKELPAVLSGFSVVVSRITPDTAHLSSTEQCRIVMRALTTMTGADLSVGGARVADFLAGRKANTLDIQASIVLWPGFCVVDLAVSPAGAPSETFIYEFPVLDSELTTANLDEWVRTLPAQGRLLPR